MEFTLDPFQKRAIEHIEAERSVLISAPTGAGKTLIAERAIEKALGRGESVIYTAPIKALSNQKYRDFRVRFGDERVGILTGDVSINPDAPILIMTTEIYRNSLFEHERHRIEKVGWVIFDEIHYLDDAERGTVWEEALLFTPETIRILALSATVPNVDQLAEWIRSIHNRPIEVVEDSHRPVPLHFLYQCQDKIFDDTRKLKQFGYLNRLDWKMSPREKRRGFHMPRARFNRLDHLLRSLLERERLPMIYFAFGRRRAEKLAWDASEFDFLTDTQRPAVIEKFNTLIDKYDLAKEKSAQDMRPLIELGIAYHHAGMLPSLKEVVEQLFTAKLVKAIFTTETFALGINMPARCVIFDELEKFYGSGFRFLTTRDFYQMAGRAGRRGMDTEGFVYVRIQPNDIPLPEVERIIFGKPEAIRSQLNTAYATLLNLYRTLGPGLLELYPKTFHHFQSVQKKRRKGRQSIENKLNLLQEMGYIVHAVEHPTVPTTEEAPWGLTSKGEFAASLFGYELILSEMHSRGDLDQFDEVELNMLLSSLIYEPRKGSRHPRLTPIQDKIRKKSEHFARAVHREEQKYHISPYTKLPHFYLAQAVQAWTEGISFEKLMRLTEADEGELVRHFRMIIQLLRELLHAPHTSEVLKTRASNARKLINRDVVDAERQLRV